MKTVLSLSVSTLSILLVVFLVHSKPAIADDDRKISNIMDIRDLFLDPCRALETVRLSQLVYFLDDDPELTQVPSAFFQENTWIDQNSTEVLISKKVDTGGDFSYIPSGSGVVTFRGSEETADWIVNFDQVKVPFGYPNHTIDYPMYQIAPDGTNLEQILIEVHRGFNEMFELYDDVKAKINDLNLDTNAVLYVNGHSLGGANAMLFAVHYAFSNPTKQVELTTFGAPRVGNRGLKLFAERLKNLNIWRIVNLKDAIPRVPYDKYEHAGHLYWKLPSQEVKAYYRQIGDESRGLKGVQDFASAAFNAQLLSSTDVQVLIEDHYTTMYRAWFESACRDPTSVNSTMDYESL